MIAKEVMGRFMGRLNEEGFAKENRPNSGPELTKKFVAEQLTAYTELLNTRIFESKR